MTIETIGSLGLPDGAVIGRAFASYPTWAAISSATPQDDTKPQITEGTEICSVTVTPKATTHRIRIRFHAYFNMASAGDHLTVALFDGSTDAIAAETTSIVSAGYFGQCFIEHEYCPATTAALTISVRVGKNSSTVYINGSTAVRRFGGASAAVLVVEEIKA